MGAFPDPFTVDPVASVWYEEKQLLTGASWPKTIFYSAESRIPVTNSTCDMVLWLVTLQSKKLAFAVLSCFLKLSPVLKGQTETILSAQ